VINANITTADGWLFKRISTSVPTSMVIVAMIRHEK
jgi:hypothetical protein